MQDTFQIRVPATMANLGPGFDSFGLAVTLYNHFAFTPADRDGLLLSPESSVDVSGLSTTPAESILFRAMAAFYRKIGAERPPVCIEMRADIPVARGLGSSSTAIIAALLAANRMAGDPMSRRELLDVAIELEGHPDNVAPALLGGVILYDNRPYELPWPQTWGIAAVIPDYPVLTEEARRALPATYSLPDAVFNLRKASLLTYALLQGDEQAFRDCLDDRLHQPYRQPLIRDYPAVRAVAEEAGALGTIISGSGSTMAVFYPRQAGDKLLAGLKSCATGKKGLVVVPLEPDLQGAQSVELAYTQP